MIKYKLVCAFSFLGCLSFLSCTPLKSSPKEEKHQMELTIHEMQTGIDDLKHDYNSYQTELQILDGKINSQKNEITLKQEQLESQTKKIDILMQKISKFENKLQNLEATVKNCAEDIRQLSTHANETSLAFSQVKNKNDELERKILLQDKKFEKIGELRSIIQSIASSVQSFAYYKVKRGDSLEKIAKDHQTSVDYLKKINHLENDLIVIGQELKIPSH
ncbi:MAG: hypothetical protein COT84_08635 [Chlamydiae bacterium CG10_big_fil_rev_8_21_14_0_10_35_9]|nr:MAG: hypothetical protein COT84_08635 [Chlamydiae bacterium CG10_big_fil_rev_8_21_14_0_10_35_9]